MLQILFLIFATMSLASADVAVMIGGEIDSAHGFKTVGTVSTVSNICGLFNSSLPDMPSGKKAASAAYLDNKIYVCGGYHPLREEKTCFMLDLSQDPLEWKEIASMNYGRYRLALVASGNHIYAVGGDGAFSNRNDVEVYDPVEDVWAISDILELPGFHEGFCAIPYKDEGIYIAGGYDEFGDRKRLQYMNLKDGSLTTLDHMYENRTLPACTPYRNGFAVAGGWSGNSEIIGDVKPNSKVEYFDFDTAEWSYMSDMNHRRAEFGLAGVANGEYLIALAGWQGQQLDTYETFTPDGEDGLSGVWDYGKPRLNDGVSEISVVTIPSEMFPGECE